MPPCALSESIKKHLFAHTLAIAILAIAPTLASRNERAPATNYQGPIFRYNDNDGDAKNIVAHIVVLICAVLLGVLAEELEFLRSKVLLD